MSDTISLRDVRVETVIGVFEHERAAPRTLSVDIDLECPLDRAGASDALEDTVDYFALVRRVRERASAARHRLIEALAAEIAALCLADGRVTRARVTVHKAGAVEGAGDVAVTVDRRR